MSEVRSISIDELLENSEENNVVDCAAIVFDVMKRTIRIPSSIYKALGEPTAAQMMFNYDSGRLIIVRQLLLREKGKVGRLCRERWVFDKRSRSNDLFVVRPIEYTEMCQYLPAAMPIDSAEADNMAQATEEDGVAQDKRFYAKYSIPGKLIDGKIAVFDLKNGSALSKQTVNRLDGYKAVLPEGYKPFCVKKQVGVKKQISSRSTNNGF